MESVCSVNHCKTFFLHFVSITLALYFYFTKQEAKRGHTEQTEKARLRHNHALAQLHLEEVSSG